MVNIILQTYEFDFDVIRNVDGYFYANYDKSWFQSNLAKALIKDIDNTEYISGEYFESAVLGGIPPTNLSNWVKSCLILLNESDVIVCGERFGDNCVKWINEIGKLKDITITLSHFFKDRDITIDAVIWNDGRVVKNTREINYAILDLMRD